MNYRNNDIEFEIVNNSAEPESESHSEGQNYTQPRPKTKSRTVSVDEQSPFHEQPHSDNSSKKSVSILKIFLGDYMENDKFRAMIPYIIFVTILAILYIYNGFAINAKYRRKAQLTEQVKELRAKSMAFNAFKMQSIQRSSILNKCNEFGLELEESVTPPKIIEK